jgi:tRNA (adenine-N(1)-)-methyltransferase non-catalytic subunit
MFSVIEPTVYEICTHHFEKQQSKTRDLRPDTLSQMMNMANVRPGGKYIIVEDVHGLVVAAALERMGGEFSPHSHHASSLA